MKEKEEFLALLRERHGHLVPREGNESTWVCSFKKKRKKIASKLKKKSKFINCLNFFFLESRLSGVDAGNT